MPHHFYMAVEEYRIPQGRSLYDLKGVVFTILDLFHNLTCGRRRTSMISTTTRGRGGWRTGLLCVEGVKGVGLGILALVREHKRELSRLGLGHEGVHHVLDVLPRRLLHVMVGKCGNPRASK
jgi:hypothetical protein